MEQTPAHTRANTIRPYQQVHDNAGSILKVDDDVFRPALLSRDKFLFCLNVTRVVVEVLMENVKDRFAWDYSRSKWQTGEVHVGRFVEKPGMSILQTP